MKHYVRLKDKRAGVLLQEILGPRCIRQNIGFGFEGCTNRLWGFFNHISTYFVDMEEVPSLVQALLDL